MKAPRKFIADDIDFDSELIAISRGTPPKIKLARRYRGVIDVLRADYVNETARSAAYRKTRVIRRGRGRIQAKLVFGSVLIWPCHREDLSGENEEELASKLERFVAHADCGRYDDSLAEVVAEINDTLKKQKTKEK